jgi:Calcium-activated chloride channel
VNLISLSSQTLLHSNLSLDSFFSCLSDDVKDYYGERIGIYFLYLQHYVTLLMVPAFFGLITYIGIVLCCVVLCRVVLCGVA